MSSLVKRKEKEETLLSERAHLFMAHRSHGEMSEHDTHQQSLP